MKTRFIIAQAALVIGLSVAIGVADGLAGGPYDLSWNTINGGGGTSAGGGYALDGTIGQHDAGGPLAGGGYELTGGFWPGATPINDCPADTNNDNLVNVTDLLAVIGSWGTCTGCPADINNDGLVNVTDLLAVIGAWGSCP